MKFLLRQRHQRKQTAVSPLLALPPEIRFLIYNHVAPKFLPEAPPSQYQGLYLSCKLAKMDLDGECCRAAPRALETYTHRKGCEIESSSEVLSDFRSFSFSITHEVLHSGRCQLKILNILKALFSLHLGHIRIIIQDVNLPSQESVVSRGAINLENGDLDEGVTLEDAFDLKPLRQVRQGYSVPTTYADIIPFASRISCLIAPDLCIHRQHVSPSLCMANRLNGERASSDPGYRSPVNIQSVAFDLGILDPETIFNRPIYLHPGGQYRGNPGYRSSPLHEQHLLKRHFWYMSAEGLEDSYDYCNSPTRFQWTRCKLRLRFKERIRYAILKALSR